LKGLLYGEHDRSMRPTTFEVGVRLRDVCGRIGPLDRWPHDSRRHRGEHVVDPLAIFGRIRRVRSDRWTGQEKRPFRVERSDLDRRRCTRCRTERDEQSARPKAVERCLECRAANRIKTTLAFLPPVISTTVWEGLPFPRYFRRAFFAAARPLFIGAVILKSSSFLPVFSAAASHRGFSPRPAHVSSGLSGLRYFGATAPRRPPRTPFPRDPPAARRSNLLSWS
jgi:hypothetical protein